MLCGFVVLTWDSCVGFFFSLYVCMYVCCSWGRAGAAAAERYRARLAVCLIGWEGPVAVEVE